MLRAAELHGVLRTTLQDCVKGKVMQSCFLTEVTTVGYGRTKKQVKFLVEMVAKDKGVLRSTTKDKAGKVWFMQSMHPSKGDPTAHV